MITAISSELDSTRLHRTAYSNQYYQQETRNKKQPFNVYYHIHLCNVGQLEYLVGMNQVSPPVSPRADGDCYLHSLIYEIVDFHRVGL